MKIIGQVIKKFRKRKWTYSEFSYLRPLQPAPSFWAMIPVRIEKIKYPERSGDSD